MLNVSKRSSALGTENAFVVLAEVNDLIRSGKDITSFCIGQPDFSTPKNIQAAAVKAIQEGKHGYTPSAGIIELRQEISNYLKSTRNVLYEPDNIVVAAGAKPFIMYSILATTDYGSGDEVIYPNPGFPIYESQIRAMGACPVPIHLREEFDFSLDPDELERIITPKTKLLILNSPHNPTGGSIPRKSMEQIVSILRKNPQVWVYADEIYSQLCYDDEFVSIIQFPDMLERTIICDGVSKTWAMTGWRLGFAANKRLAEVFTKWVTNTESCASQISQWAAVEAYAGDKTDVRLMYDSFLQRRDLIVDLTNQIPGVTCQIPGGAFYTYPNIGEACEMVGAEDAEEFRKRLLYEAGVAVLADIHFGERVPGASDYIRFSYAASVDAIKEGISKMASFIQNNKR